MQLKYIDQSRQNEWEKLVNKNPYSGYMQSFWWQEFQNLIGWETYKIGIFEKNKLLGGAIIAKYSYFKNKSIIYIPEGPVLPYEKPIAEKMFHLLIAEIDKIADLDGSNDRKPTSHLSIEPKLSFVPFFFSRFQKAKTDRQPINNLIMDLRLSKKHLLKQMKPKARYNIKVAQKHGVNIIQTSPEEGLKDFLKLYCSFNKIIPSDKKDKHYFERLIYILSRNKNGNFFFARYKNQILSSALVIYFGNTATYLFGASSKKFSFTMSPYLLHFTIMQHAKKTGYKWYDWYGLSPDENNVNHPWYGFSVFKKKFGGQQINYIGAYDFVYNRKLYITS